MRGTAMSANAPHPEAWENALAAFENDLYSRGRSEKTVVTYGSCLQNFAQFYRRELQKPGPYIARLEENDFEAFIDHIQYDRRLSAPSVNRYIAALRAFSGFILFKRWHRRLLSRDLKSYRIDTSRPPASLSRKEVHLMIAAVDEKSRNAPRNMALLQLMLQCGLRVGEIVRLLREDVTLHKSVGSLRVRAAKPEHERTIPLNAAARRALQNHMDTMIPGSGSDPLFISERGRPMGVGSVQYLVKKSHFV